MNDIIAHFKTSTQQSILQLKDELKGIRTGRANPGMIENLAVETYGGSMKMKLMEIATIMTDGASALVVMPFDPATTHDIEKGIMTSPLGITPKTDGSKITIRIPPLSEEQRVKYLRFASQLIEDTKNKIRNSRDEARKKIKRMQDDKEIGEDDRFRGEKDIDQMMAALNEELLVIKQNKEKEIMEV